MRWWDGQQDIVGVVPIQRTRQTSHGFWIELAVVGLVTPQLNQNGRERLDLVVSPLDRLVQEWKGLARHFLKLAGKLVKEKTVEIGAGGAGIHQVFSRVEQRRPDRQGHNGVLVSMDAGRITTTSP